MQNENEFNQINDTSEADEAKVLQNDKECQIYIPSKFKQAKDTFTCIIYASCEKNSRDVETQTDLSETTFIAIANTNKLK